jgi:HSP20 family molecular chaperone IbpA
MWKNLPVWEKEIMELIKERKEKEQKETMKPVVNYFYNKMNQLELFIETPGVEKNDISVELNKANPSLHITAIRKDLPNLNNSLSYRLDIFLCIEDYNLSKIAWTYRNAVIHLSLPKKENQEEKIKIPSTDSFT